MHLKFVKGYAILCPSPANCLTYLNKSLYRNELHLNEENLKIIFSDYYDIMIQELRENNLLLIMPSYIFNRLHTDKEKRLINKIFFNYLQKQQILDALNNKKVLE